MIMDAEMYYRCSDKVLSEAYVVVLLLSAVISNTLMLYRFQFTPFCNSMVHEIWTSLFYRFYRFFDEVVAHQQLKKLLLCRQSVKDVLRIFRVGCNSLTDRRF